MSGTDTSATSQSFLSADAVTKQFQAHTGSHLDPEWGPASRFSCRWKMGLAKSSQKVVIVSMERSSCAHDSPHIQRDSPSPYFLVTPVRRIFAVGAMAMVQLTGNVDFVESYLGSVFAEDLHAKRVLSLALGTLGVMAGASLAVAVIGQSMAQARGRMTKHAIKQVDRLLSNRGIVVWDMFDPWVKQVVGQSTDIVVAMDWTDFDADDQATLVLSLVTSHGRATPLLWLSVLKDELKTSATISRTCAWPVWQRFCPAASR